MLSRSLDLQELGAAQPGINSSVGGLSIRRRARPRACPAFLLLPVMLLGLSSGCGYLFPSDVFAIRTEFWVSPDGDDASPGTQSAPFLTLERARDAIRALGKARREGEIVVYLRGGTYPLTQAFALDPNDSGLNGHKVTYRAAPGERPVITGSIRVENWSLHDPNLGIYRACVDPCETRQLYVNGQRAVRARTSLYPSAFRPAYFYVLGIPEPIGILYEPDELNPSRWRDPWKWSNKQDVEAVIITQWKMMTVPVESVTPYPNYVVPELVPDPTIRNRATGLLKMKEPAWTNANVFLTSEGSDPNWGPQPGMWSFWQVTWFENAYEFLDEPGEWYLNKAEGCLYYIPRPGESMESADVELPVLEVLVNGQGSRGQAVENICFEGLTFSGATWLGPAGDDGYVSDQSGFHLVGPGHETNTSGHDPNVVRTPGNVRFQYAHGIEFRRNVFMHLGGVGLDFDTGSQGNTIEDNLFTDISSAAIQLGGVSIIDHHPASTEETTRDNVISNNLIRKVGREFVDAAGIFVGFTANTLISNNTIVDVPWSGIAMGWGWGLLDEGMFPGIAGAERGDWGTYTTPTTNSGNKILNNRIQQFLNVVWDGGAIYTTGQQGTSRDDPLLIKGNVASGKRLLAGGNTFYTDGGSRYIVLTENVSYDNPQGVTDFGLPSKAGDPLPYPAYSELNGIPYGDETGGCRTYGNISFVGNYLLSSPFFDICPYSEGRVSYPVNMGFINNHYIQGAGQVPQSLLNAAGVQNFPQDVLDAAGL
ncbi:MAG: right-handed parallel beta-helix repeat-containing protein [Phycisphaerae bacterium]|nr:right-handed parallel beta-helix repeat-containing protein [Phycisphaerae bacterium]